MNFRTYVLTKITFLIILLPIISGCGNKKPKHDNMKDVAYASHGEYDQAIGINPVQLNFNYPRDNSDIKGFQSSINGNVSRENIELYLSDLLTYTEDYIEQYISKKGNYDHSKSSWYQEPWMGKQREPIIGAYHGNSNTKGTFEGVDYDQTGYVFVAYDQLAASVLGHTFDQNGKVNDDYAARFPDGSVILKFAFSELNGDKWPAMEGAPRFEILKKKSDSSSLFDEKIEVSLFQIDVVVRDQKAAETGWVFSTLVYDKDIKKTDKYLSQFVFLGAMWGNDPYIDLKSDTLFYQDNPKLTQNWINNNAPKYSKETLGTGGRLSGPNDGAVALNVIAYTDKDNTKKSDIQPRLAITSCMSCHLPAQNKFSAFLLPVDLSKDSFTVWNYNSDKYRTYFRNLKDQPFTQGEKQFDYNMAISFKSIREYQKYILENSKDNSIRLQNTNDHIRLMEKADEFRTNH